MHGLGWSDIFNFLPCSKTGTMMPIRYVFMSPIPKTKLANFAPRGKVFTLKKSQVH